MARAADLTDLALTAARAGAQAIAAVLVGGVPHRSSSPAATTW